MNVRLTAVWPNGELTREDSYRVRGLTRRTLAGDRVRPLYLIASEGIPPTHSVIERRKTLEHLKRIGAYLPASMVNE